MTDNRNNNYSDLPRGFRNNNPGNLKLTTINWNGKVPNSENTDGTFEQFVSMEYGLRAMMLDIINDITRKKKDTLQKLITEYAPESENPTENYLAFVERESGLKRNQKIPNDIGTFKKIIQAFVQFENGRTVSETIFKGGFDLLPAEKKTLFQNQTTRVLPLALAGATLLGLAVFSLKNSK